jgi:hypothetical protein
MVKERLKNNVFFLADNFFSTKTSPLQGASPLLEAKTYVDIYKRTDRLTAEIAQVNICSCKELI